MTQRHKGFSLIEVAIAMVIFVIGALAILRIFPTGISLVEKSGNQQIASNSSRSVLARLSNEDAYPDATVNTSGGLWEAYDGSVIGSSKYNRSLPKDVSAAQLLNSALDHYQSISGERVVVKQGGSTNFSYVLTQFSVANLGTAQIYKEDILENVSITGTTTKILNFDNVVTRSGLAFTPPTIGDTRDLTFYVSYKYPIGTPARIAGVDNEAIKVGTDGNVTIPNTNALAGNVEVRVKEPILNGIEPLTTEQERRCGLIKVNGVPSDSRPVLIDYTTDWYWILETLTPTAADDVFKKREIVNDELVPIQGTGDSHRFNYRQVELSIPFVQGRTSQRYATLVMENGGTGRHFSWLNVNGSQPDVDDTLIRLPHLQNDSEIDYPNYRNTLREGKIGFDITDPTATGNPAAALTNPVIRVAYRTQDGWARQLSVAARTYKPYNTTTLIERWRDYVWNPTTNRNELYFQPSEAGKSVKVTYAYGDPTADSTNDITKTELLTIDSEIQPSTNLFGTGTDGYVTLKISPPANQVTSILSVKGASVTARTAWMTNDKYSQSLVTSMRGDS